MDLSAAFNTVDHDILLNIPCDWFGLTGTALNWFNSYLRPHLCVVTVQKARSSERNLAFSVLQGSCAGPVLFCAHTSTFPQVVDSHPGILGNKDELEKISILTNSLKSINNWMNRNRLQMNNAKTEVLLIGSQSQLNKCVTSALNVNGTMVQIGRMIKYMGTFLDNGLSFKHHITTKCRIAMWNLQWLKPL